MKGRIAASVIAALLLGILAGSCAPAQAPEKVFRFGLEGAFTGPNARIGEELSGAATLAFDKIGWKIGDYKVEMVKIDNESDPEKGARAYEEAIVGNKIIAGLSNWHSSVAVAEMEVVAKHKVPHFFGTGGTDLINEKYQSDPEKYAYYIVGKVWPSPGKLSNAYALALDEAIEQGLWTPSAMKVAIYGEDTDWGRSFAKALGGQLEAVGWEITSESFFRLDEVDFLPLLNKIKSEGATLVVGTATSPSSYAGLIKQSQEAGLEALIIADGLGYLGEWYSLAGDASDYVLDQVPRWTSPEAQAFRDEFKEKFGIDPSPATGALVYDTANFFIKAANAALAEYGDLTAETMFKISQKIASGGLTFTRADGALIMDEYKYMPDSVPDPVVGAGYFVFPVIQYFGGEGKIIWPESFREQELKVP